ncbi:MAG TPA: hypothetical protein PLT67_03025, partial [Kiritimatiellia bacterium]|nr:hypothetical protein [Kiritimatiellia bacterium]
MLITLGVPAYIVFRAKHSMPTGKKWLNYLLAIGASWILIIVATELSMTLDIRYASTPEAAFKLCGNLFMGKDRKPS